MFYLFFFRSVIVSGQVDSQVQSLSWEDLLEEKKATHSSILAWRIPWTEEPGEMQSMGVTKESDMS